MCVCGLVLTDSSSRGSEGSDAVGLIHVQVHAVPEEGHSGGTEHSGLSAGQTSESVTPVTADAWHLLNYTSHLVHHRASLPHHIFILFVLTAATLTS